MSTGLGILAINSHLEIPSVNGAPTHTLTCILMCTNSICTAVDMRLLCKLTCVGPPIVNSFRMYVCTTTCMNGYLYVGGVCTLNVTVGVVLRFVLEWPLLSQEVTASNSNVP